ncbi:MAG: SUMF1/EgtB/PvdO family nonheme iron enzyme [Planctomycetes bacterium]|nr:SUMF1/EgtB/PvdO family nonheme iron enzyme [Planctomycetota bacterium]
MSRLIKHAWLILVAGAIVAWVQSPADAARAPRADALPAATAPAATTAPATNAPATSGAKAPATSGAKAPPAATAPAATAAASAAADAARRKAAKTTWGPWYVIGPFYAKDGKGFSTVFPPEQEINLGKACGNLMWAQQPNFTDGIPYVLKADANGVTYLYRKVTMPAAKTVTVYLGSDDGLAVWLNGKKLLSQNAPRALTPGSDTAALELQAGDNHLLLKVCRLGGGHGFYFSTSRKTLAATAQPATSAAAAPNFEALRLAIADLRDTWGAKYPRGAEYLSRAAALQKTYDEAKAAGGAGAERLKAAEADVAAIQREALLANPLLDFDKLLVVKRGEGKLGLPQNWVGNGGMAPRGYDNEIAALSPVRPGAELKTLYKPTGGEFVGDLELHWNADRLLLSMPGTQSRWQVFEMKTDGSGLRQVTPGDQPDVDNYDACYLPDGRILFCSTACYLGVPCVGGGSPVGSLYLLEKDGKTIRQLTFDQDHSWCPTVLNSGRIIYTRWEYSDSPHYFSRLLFEMNPDGTAQFEYYGSNSYWPNSTFYARPIPGHPTKVAAIVSGHHGVPRMGELVIFDSAKGRHEAAGAVQRIPGYGKPVAPTIADGLVNASWPKFLHPWPLSEKYFLVSCKTGPAAPWAIYLVDIFDNMVLVRQEPGYALLEPTPVRKREAPPIVPDRVNPDAKTATVYLVDVYQGKGLQGVPRGTVKNLRVYTHHFAYRGMGGHINIGCDGPWDAKRILGTVPVNEDGSALFHVPANMPIVVQPLDAEGKAIQVMRSWYTAMPGEFASCVGCHEPQTSGPPPARQTIATGRPPSEIQPWYGPARPFGFEREVQPVLDKFCAGCHNGQARPDGAVLCDLRGKGKVPNYKGIWSAAYDALHPFVRRPGPESDYHLPLPYEWHADTSELVQMLKKGHYGVNLDAEGWDRLVTWIDVNVPYHGTWSEYRKIAGDGHERRLALSKLYGGPDFDPEAYPAMPVVQITPAAPAPQAALPAAAAAAVPCAGWPFDAAEAVRRQSSSGPAARTIDLGNGVTMDLVRIPAGEFVMGDPAGGADERPASRVAVPQAFWIGKFEVTNEQYAAFDPAHDSAYISVFNKDQSNRGVPANGPQQPAIRISWTEASAFCRWLSQRIGEKVMLPSEVQWEHACRAGTATPLSFGPCDADFSKWANLADQSVLVLCRKNSPKWIPSVPQVNDGSTVSNTVGKYAPNAWGLSDMHGNVWEWTRSEYRPYPYRADDGRDADGGAARRVVRGGSWWDRPVRARSSYRLSYLPWQAVHNVGFRVVIEGGAKVLAAAGAGQ